MGRVTPVRFMSVLLAGTIGTCGLPGQSIPMTGQSKPSAAIQNISTLPAAQSTSAPAPAAVARRPGEMPAHRAAVTYRDGSLTVNADNSSLNQILRDIAQQTRMKITGGVTEERVFGSYGPADPAKVLSMLLDGTGSNMLLIAGSKEVANELILTPRAGGPTPPSPSATVEQVAPEPVDRPPDGSFRPGDRTPPESQTMRTQAQPQLQAQPQTGAQDTTPEPAAGPAAAAPVAPAADATQVQSPNGVKTPQQIYDQLLKLQKQQQPPPQ